MSGDSIAGTRRSRLTRRSALIAAAAGGAALFTSAAYAQRATGVIRAYAPPRQLRDVDHAVVYRRDNEFNGWPHIRGFWDLGSGELLQNFNSVPADYANPAALSHDQLYGAPGRKMVTIRSRDYGRTWGASHAVFDAYDNIAPAARSATTLADLGPIDFSDRGTLLSSSSTDFAHANARSWLRVSRDRGVSWSPALPVPLDGLHSLSAINSSLLRPDGTVLLFLFEVGEGGFDRHPLVYALPPRGEDFHFLSFVTPKADPYGAADGDYAGTARFGGHRWFYPRGYLLPNGRILCVLRCQRDPRGDMWTEVYASDDGGLTWGFLSRVNEFGAPGSLVRLRDGRLVMVYGYRLMPSGIRAKVSQDEGRTWGPELIVRDDGGSWDLGYPNAWATNDGKVGVIYYFNSKDDPIQANGGVRHIARSIFSVD